MSEKFDSLIKKLFSLLCFQQNDLLAVHMDKAHTAEDDRESFGDREGKPHGVKTTDPCEDKCHRQKNDKLTEHGDP